MQKSRLIRRRTHSVLLAAATIALGLASRKFAFVLPPWLAKNAGDALYAVMIYWLIGVCFPRVSPPRAALAALGFCAGIEFLKLVQFPWLVAARHSTAGALVLGRGFHWSNLVCYTLGVLLASGLETRLGPHRGP